MENHQLWTQSGTTDFDWYEYEMKEYNEPSDTETYYIVEGQIKHDLMNSISTLKYRFVDFIEALNYYEKARKLHPKSRLSLTKRTLQSMREFA